MPPELKAFFEPKSVVLLGASESGGKENVSTAFFNSLAHNISRFTKGKVYGVDLSGKISGYAKKLTKVPKGCDLAVVSLSRELLTKNLSSLLAKRTKALVLVSGDTGQKQMEELANSARKRRFLLLGPSATTGVVNTSNGLVASPERGLALKQGHIAMISQDGGVGAAMLDLARFQSVGVSKFACVGDGLGVDAVELLQYFAQDKETKAICIYLETIRDGRRLVGAVGEVTRSKPVVIFKGGMEDKIFDAALKQVGAFQARSVDELLAVAEGLAKQPPMRGNRVAVITNVPGQAKLVMRSLVNEGLVPAEPSDGTVEKISKKYPNVKISNFIDLGPDAREDVYKFVVEQVASDKAVDGIAVISATKSTIFRPEDISGVAGVAKKAKDKPVVDLVPGVEDNRLIRGVSGTELPICWRPWDVARVLKFLSIRWKMLEKAAQK